jgi:putative endonuclease
MATHDSTPTSATARGAAAEQAAADYLARQGLAVLARNYRIKGGEIDLICRDRRILVFVEVRARASNAFGGAAASIDTRKQARLILAARHYLQRLPQPDTPCRFDCVLLDAGRLTWLKDAFRADE